MTRVLGISYRIIQKFLLKIYYSDFQRTEM
nr:MAG TPA: hypothetical protein [Bacteriophage sp.]